MAKVNKQSSVLKDIREITKRSGYKMITVAGFMKSMGYQKRSPSNIANLDELLRANKLYIYPKITMDTDWKQSIRIYSFPHEALGDLFRSEAELESYVHMKKKYLFFNVVKVVTQYSPKQTRDRLDMLGYDKNNEPVVIEFKNADGGKSSVEQVFRYISHVKSTYPGKKVRGILVTGVRGVDTAKAIHGMSPERRAEFEWYLYKYDKAKDNITFHKVSDDYIKKALPG